MRQLALVLIAAYRRCISPLKPACCRFTPTCSAYAAEAIASHGLVSGSWLAARRLSRCHPWGGSGFDPVPARAACPDCGSQPMADAIPHGAPPAG